MAQVLFAIAVRTILCILFYLLIFTLLFGYSLTWTSVLIFVVISTFFELVDEGERRNRRR